MKINTLRDFERVEPGQIVAGTGASRGYSVAATRSFYREPEGGFVPYSQESRTLMEIDLKRLRDLGLPVRPSTLLEEHDLVARHPENGFEPYTKLAKSTSLVLDGVIIPQGGLVECRPLDLGPFYVDFSQAKRGISRQEAVEGNKARRSILLKGVKIIQVLKSPQVLDRYIFVPEGVYPLNFPLTGSARFRRDQISRETGFVESTFIPDDYQQPDTFFFSPGYGSISYPTLTRGGDVILNNSFSRFGLDLGVRLASDQDIGPVVDELLQAKKLEKTVVVRKEERFLEFPGIQVEEHERRLTSGLKRQHGQSGN